MARSSYRKRFLTTASFGLILSCSLPAGALAQATLKAWGSDTVGQVSDVPLGPRFQQVAIGTSHGVGLRDDGSLVSWGAENFGQVSNTPAGSGFIQVAAGGNISGALRADGSIVAWGWDLHGMVSDVPSGTGYTQISIGSTVGIALHADGSLATWGVDTTGTVLEVPSGTNFVEVAAGGGLLALLGDGTLVSWGNDDSGQVTNTPTGTGFVHVAASTTHRLALRADGSIVAWGADLVGEVSGAPPGPGFTSVQAGQGVSAAVGPGGRLYVWGRDEQGQVSDAPVGSGFHSIAASHFFLAATWQENTGEAYCLGDGTGILCPCGTTGPVGAGCLNSLGNGALLTGVGHASFAGDSFRLEVAGVPGNKPGLLLRGASQLNGSLGILLGDGLLCTGGQAARSQIQVTTAGSTTFSDFQGSPFGASAYGPGVSTNYQYWYRDSLNPCSGQGFNFSNAWSVAWEL